MHEESRILFSLRKVLRPILQVLLRAKIGIRPIINALRLAIVEAAVINLEESGSRINNSVISRMTGMDRREIGQIRQFLAKEKPPGTLKDSDQLARVLATWANTDEFLDSKGQPKILKTTLDSPSFADVVSRANVTQSAAQILDRLLAVACVEIVDDDSVRLIKRATDVSQDLAVLLIDTVETSASTLPINYRRTDERSFPQKVTFVYPPNQESQELVRRIARQRILSFVEELDSQLVTLMHRFANYGDDKNRTKRVGVAVSYFEIDP